MRLVLTYLHWRTVTSRRPTVTCMKARRRTVVTRVTFFRELPCANVTIEPSRVVIQTNWNITGPAQSPPVNVRNKGGQHAVLHQINKKCIDEETQKCGVHVKFNQQVLSAFLCVVYPTHLPLDEMATTSPTIFLDAYSWMKIFAFWLKFHWSLFLKVQLTITQHWFR